MLPNKLLFILLLVIFCCLNVNTKVPQRCDETTFIYTNIYDDTINDTISGTLKVEGNKNGSNSITISNGEFGYSNGSHDIYYENTTFCMDSNSYSCFRNKNSTTVLIGDGLFFVWGFVDRFIGGFVGIVDDQSFIFPGGQFFDENNKCYSTHTEHTQRKTSTTQCCTSFKPITSITPDTPQCKKIAGTTVVYNETGNNIIYQSVVINFDLSDGNFTLTGSEDWSDAFYQIDIQDFIECTKNENDSLHTRYCNYPINGNSKLLFYLPYRSENITRSMWLAAKIIIRDTQTLMEEGIPFSPTNKCSKMNQTLGNLGLFGVSEFCCSEFEGDTNTNAANLFNISYVFCLCLFFLSYYN